MKPLAISLLLLLGFQSVSQVSQTAFHPEVKDLMRKSETQKTAAFILTSLAPMVLIFDAPSTSMRGMGMHPDGKSERLHAASYVLSAACLIGGVALQSRIKEQGKSKSYEIKLLSANGTCAGWDFNTELSIFPGDWS